MSFSSARQFREQSVTLKRVIGIGLVVTLIKFTAYYITKSEAIFSDALESIINIATGVFALFSIYYAAQPKDENHPYGHGKIEFLAAGFEGAMILVAGLSIIAKAVFSWLHAKPIDQLDIGAWLTAAAGLINYVLGSYLVRVGQKSNSLTLVADGKHLLSDTWSSVGLLVGLIIIYFTGMLWLDSLLACIFGVVIIFTGYKLLRGALAGLLDELDPEVLREIETIVNSSRKNEWIDIHNFRILRYGAHYHIDCHITLPWYWSLEQSHSEVQNFENIFRKKFPERVELFIHADPCLPASCAVCLISDCPHRQNAFREKVEWKISLLVKNEKHLPG